MLTGPTPRVRGSWLIIGVTFVVVFSILAGPRAASLFRSRTAAPADPIDALIAGHREAEAWASPEIKATLLGSEDPGAAESLSHAAGLMWHREEYREALPLAQRALAIRMERFGPRHLSTAGSYYQVAELLRMAGDYAGAMRLHEQALSVWQTEPADQQFQLAASSSLYYLGVLHRNMGDYAAARSFIRRSLDIRERAGDSARELVAVCLNSLGGLAALTGNRREAMSLFARARETWEESLGPDHPHVARGHASQGNLLAEDGDYAAASKLLVRALQIRLRAFGPGHYLVARGHASLARLASLTGEDAEAERRFREAIAIQEQAPVARGPEIARTYADYARHVWGAGDLTRAIDLALRAESMAREHFLRTSQGLEDHQALRYGTVRVTGLDVALSAMVQDGASRSSPRRVWGEVVQSRAMVLDAMARRNREAGDRVPASLSPGDLAGRLPPSAALVSYVRYNRLGRGRAAATPSFLAMILASEASPIIVPLGAASTIETAIRQWRAEAGADPRMHAGDEAERRYHDAGRRLREAIWDPLAPALGDRELVFVVPDGALSLVTLSALPLEDGRYLLEDSPSIHYLSAERDLLSRRAEPHRYASVLVLGGAEFDAIPIGFAPPNGGYHGASPACGVFASVRFEPLPGTVNEVDDVAAQWSGKAGVLKLTGPAASESAFKARAPGQRILHLATHGYFVQDRCLSAIGGPAGEDGMILGENPLLLSGFALAGANHRDAAAPGTEDGILTAEEIGALDLSDVEWAVLSGCETGMGQVIGGEGVLGLRRAFQVAGAGTLIMSLWPVDDGAARIWMRHLYEGRLAGLSTVEAVRSAGLRMLLAQRNRGRTTHPYYWGAFVAAGDWR